MLIQTPPIVTVKLADIPEASPFARVTACGGGVELDDAHRHVVLRALGYVVVVGDKRLFGVEIRFTTGETLGWEWDADTGEFAGVIENWGTASPCVCLRCRLAELGAQVEPMDAHGNPLASAAGLPSDLLPGTLAMGRPLPEA
jgi:hypothetical protein